MPLTDEQRRRIIQSLQRGEDLPLDDQYLLFPPDRREYALVYAHKERAVDILANTMSVPLQEARTFGEDPSDWHNHLIFGDNLHVMKRLLDEKEAGRLCNADGTPGVRLIYIDPPFATKQEFRGSREQKAYQDRVAGAQFVEFLRKRLVLLQALLARDGVLCVHLDFRKKHYIKVILDEIFGEHNFRNEIAVSRIKKSIRERERVRKLNEEFDTILVYANSEAVTLLPPMRNLAREARWHAFDAAGVRTGMDYDLFGHTPPVGRHWMYSKERANQMIADGTLRPHPRTGRPQYLIAASDQDLCNNLWTDIGAYAFITGYPTEKSEALLSRVLDMASQPGDLVLDAFAGSGTTCAVAEKLGRRWIGIDSGKFAIYTIQKRLLNLKEEIGNRGAPRQPTAFTLYNAGLYDFSTLKHLPWDAWRFFALQLFECRDEPHTIAGMQLDGKRKGHSVLVYKHQDYPGSRIDEETIQNIHIRIGNKIDNRLYIIAPKGMFAFQQDYLECDDIRYYALRIPYSFIHELHNHREFTALRQPNDELAVNELVDAYGFDFIHPPTVTWSVGIGQRNNEEAFLHIHSVTSRVRLRGTDKPGGLETLSMLMLDYDYHGTVFAFDAAFYADDLKTTEWRAWFPREQIGAKVMAVFIDIYGNESQVVIPSESFTATVNETT